MQYQTAFNSIDRCHEVLCLYIISENPIIKNQNTPMYTTGPIQFAAEISACSGGSCQSNTQLPLKTITPKNVLKLFILSSLVFLCSILSLALNANPLNNFSAKNKGSENNNILYTQNRPGVTRPTLEINLLAKDVDGSIYLADGVMLNFDNVYSANVDNNDVRKIMNTADNLAIKNGNYNLVVERRPNLSATDTIKLSLTGIRVAPYRFVIDPSVLGNTGLEAFLIDKFLQTEIAVSFTNVTSVPFDITSTPASYAGDRFMIVFKLAPTTNFTTIAALRHSNNTVSINWGIENERNISNYTVEQSNDGTNFTAIATQTASANNGTNPTYSKLDAAASKANNWYRVKATNSNGTIKYTAIAMVGAVNEITIFADAKISIYPNPVVGGKINLQLTNQAKGNYSVQLTNAMGQVIQIENVPVYNNNVLHTIRMGNTATGTYHATVINEAGKKTTIVFLVK
jgi:Secretion system C-terminal sorting domain